MMEKSIQSNWHEKSDLEFKTRDKNELDHLAEDMVNWIKSKGHARDMSGPVRSSPDWNSIITESATGAVNVLLSIGGTIDEIEYVIRKMYDIDRSLFEKWGNFVDNSSGETQGLLKKNHIRYMAGDRKDKPGKGFVFERSCPLDQLSGGIYVRVIGTWSKSGGRHVIPSDRSTQEMTVDKPDFNSYLPTREDVEMASKTLGPSGEDVLIEQLLDWLENNITQKGLILHPEWKFITERNIEIWSKKTG